LKDLRLVLLGVELVDEQITKLQLHTHAQHMGLLMALSFDNINQHILIFSFFMLTDEHEITWPWGVVRGHGIGGSLAQLTSRAQSGASESFSL